MYRGTAKPNTVRGLGSTVVLPLVGYRHGQVRPALVDLHERRRKWNLSLFPSRFTAHGGGFSSSARRSRLTERRDAETAALAVRRAPLAPRAAREIVLVVALLNFFRAGRLDHELDAVHAQGRLHVPVQCTQLARLLPCSGATRQHHLLGRRAGSPLVVFRESARGSRATLALRGHRDRVCFGREGGVSPQPALHTGVPTSRSYD